MSNKPIFDMIIFAIAALVFLSFSVICFYLTFKKYNQENDTLPLNFLPSEGLISLIFVIPLLLFDFLKEFFPLRWNFIIFKLVSFIIGALCLLISTAFFIELFLGS